MDAKSHHQSKCLDNAAIQSVRPREGSQQTIPHPWRATDDGAGHEQRGTGDPVRATNDHDVLTNLNGIKSMQQLTMTMSPDASRTRRVHGLGASCG